MPKHADFQQIYANMLAQYGKEKGERIYCAWLANEKLDDTKPYPKKEKKEVTDMDLNKSETGELLFKMYLPIEKSVDGQDLFGGIASSSAIDRDGDIMSPEALAKGAMDLMANSTVFFNHKHDQLAVGKVVKSWVEGGTLRVNIKPSKAKGVEDIITQINEGVLKSFSIGGKITETKMQWDEQLKKDVRVVKGVNLYEVSVVGIPANPDASITSYLSKAFNPQNEYVPTKEEKSGGDNMDEKSVAVPAVSAEVKKEVAPVPPEIKIEKEAQADSEKCSKCGQSLKKSAETEKSIQQKVEPVIPASANEAILKELNSKYTALEQEVSELKKMRAERKGLVVDENPVEIEKQATLSTAPPISHTDMKSDLLKKFRGE